jgi:hypothetical protein
VESLYENRTSPDRQTVKGRLGVLDGGPMLLDHFADLCRKMPEYEVVTDADSETRLEINPKPDQSR